METGCTTKAAEAPCSPLMGGGQDTGKPVTLPHDASVGKPPRQPGGKRQRKRVFVEENCNYTKEFVLKEEDKDKNIWLEL